MLREVRSFPTLKKEDFLQYTNVREWQEILHCAELLRGKKVVHINATAKGGGVAELLHSVIPYMKALGIRASWYAIDSKKAGSSFFDFTNRLHNSLQGSIRKFSREEWQMYEKVNREIAKDIDAMGYDILVVHDPQPLGALSFCGNHMVGSRAVCVIHIDTTTPDPLVWKKIFGFIHTYDSVIFSNEHFVNGDIAKEKVRIFAPAIDPLAYKQTIVPVKKAREYLARFGVPQIGSLVVQVSRFDIWKNPHGVIEAFWLLEKKHPKGTLAMVGFQEARDNPEAEKVYMDIRGMVGKDPHIFLFFDPKRIGGARNIQEFTVMAQNAADIIVQNSTKEGFGLTVTEAMWKGKAVVGGPATGIQKQIHHDQNGYIANNTKELVERLDFLLQHPKDRKRVGAMAQQSVRERFLMPRYVVDHLKAYTHII
jgi:trehalose synthase